MTKQQKACSDIERDITRYAYGSEMTRAERSRAEEHLKDCSECSELVAFIRQSRSVVPIGAKAHTTEAIPSCIDTDTIVALGEGSLHGAAKERVQEHILNCASCRDEYLVWCSLDDAYLGPEVLASSDKSSSGTQRIATNGAAKGTPQVQVADSEEYKRLAAEHQQYSRRLDSLKNRQYLSDDEKLEEVRLKKLRLRLKDKMDLLKGQSEQQFRRSKNKRA